MDRPAVALLFTCVHAVTGCSAAWLLLSEWGGVLSLSNAQSDCQALLWWLQTIKKRPLRSKEGGQDSLAGGPANAVLHSGLYSAGKSLGSISLASLGADLDADDMEAVQAMLCNSD